MNKSKLETLIEKHSFQYSEPYQFIKEAVIELITNKITELKQCMKKCDHRKAIANTPEKKHIEASNYAIYACQVDILQELKEEI